MTLPASRLKVEIEGCRYSKRASLGTMAMTRWGVEEARRRIVFVAVVLMVWRPEISNNRASTVINLVSGREICATIQMVIQGMVEKTSERMWRKYLRLFVML